MMCGCYGECLMVCVCVWCGDGEIDGDVWVIKFLIVD